jgi:hypothetical protein
MGNGQPQAFECQLLPTAKGVNSPKMELFDAVARLEPGLVEFSHALDQSGQAVIHRWLVPLILDDRGKQEPVFTRRGFVHIRQDPPSWDPFQQLLKEAGIYSSQRWRCRESPIPP